jgi:hypothetical protein
MAVTKDDLDQFKYFYSLEDDRAKSLTGTGNIYTTLIGVFLGYLGYKSTDTQFAKLLVFDWYGCRIGLALYLLVFVFLLIALAFTLWSLFMHNYERVTDPEEFLNYITDGNWDQDMAFRELEVYFSEAANRNFAMNNDRAMKLTIGSYFLFAAVVAYALAFILVVTR